MRLRDSGRLRGRPARRSENAPEPARKAQKRHSSGHAAETKVEAAIGFEPMHEGFANPCLNHLATPPPLSMITRWRWEINKGVFLDMAGRKS